MTATPVKDTHVSLCENDLIIFNAAKKRIENHFLQFDIFKTKPEIIFHSK
jgi:hypothetical protein